MATDARSIFWVQTTDAEFRAWVAAVIAQLNAIGLVQTADTGQIDTATVTRPGGTNTQAGYAVFRFDDALQSSKPVFLRFGFGTGSSVNNPSLWLTLGTATDGAGNLSNLFRTAVQRTMSFGSVTAEASACFDPATGTLWAHWPTNAQNTMLIMARTADPDTEEPTEQGIVVSWTNTGGDLELVPWATMVSANQPVGAPPGLGVAGYVYAEDGVPVVWRHDGYCPVAPSGFFTLPGLLYCYTTDFPPGEIVTVAPAGTERSYRAHTDPTINQGAWTQGSMTNERLLLVWE